MTWSAPSAFAFAAFSSVETVVMTVAPTALASWIAAVPMPAAAGLDQHRLPGFKMRVVEQHVLDGAVGDRRARRVDDADAGGRRHDEPRRKR